MRVYIVSHWRGEQTLVQSYWVNLFFVSFLIRFFLEIYNQSNIFEALSFNHTVALDVSINLTVWVITIWSMVGVWRSATAHAASTGGSFWAGAAKVIVVLGLLGSLAKTAMFAQDYQSIIKAINAPDLNEFVVQKYGDNEVYFAGAINDKSVNRMIDVLNSMNSATEKLLRVNSIGGLVTPALHLAEYINTNKITVMAETQCNSACVILMAASPYTILATGATVMFHQTEPLASFKTPEWSMTSNRELAAIDSQVDDALRVYYLADWAIEKANLLEHWTPTVQELIDMRLIVSIWDTTSSRLYSADEYCAALPQYCAQTYE